VPHQLLTSRHSWVSAESWHVTPALRAGKVNVAQALLDVAQHIVDTLKAQHIVDSAPGK